MKKFFRKIPLSLLLLFIATLGFSEESSFPFHDYNGTSTNNYTNFEIFEGTHTINLEKNKNYTITFNTVDEIKRYLEIQGDPKVKILLSFETPEYNQFPISKMVKHMEISEKTQEKQTLLLNYFQNYTEFMNELVFYGNNKLNEVCVLDNKKILLRLEAEDGSPGNTQISYNLDELIVLEYGEETDNIVNKERQVFQINYIKNSDFAIPSTGIQFNIRSKSNRIITLLLVANENVPSPNEETGKSLSTSTFGLGSKEIMVVKKDVYQDSQILFFEVFMQNIQNTNNVYTVTLTYAYLLNWTFFLYFLLFGIGLFFVFGIVLCSFCRYFSSLCRRQHNREINMFTTQIGGDNKSETKIVLPQPDSIQYQKRRENIPEEEVCVVCLDYQRNTKFLPCDHFCTCKFCAEAIFNSSKSCPICRSEIKELKKMEVKDYSKIEPEVDKDNPKEDKTDIKEEQSPKPNNSDPKEIELQEEKKEQEVNIHGKGETRIKIHDDDSSEPNIEYKKEIKTAIDTPLVITSDSPTTIDSQKV